MFYPRLFSARSAPSTIPTSGVRDFEPPPSAIPAGFDSILQFSSRLLEQTLVSHLRERGVLSLSSRVPCQQELFAPNFWNIIQAHLTRTDRIRPGLFLEVQLTNPQLQTLREQQDTKPESTWQHVRAAHLVWTLHVNLFRAKIDEFCTIHTWARGVIKRARRSSQRTSPAVGTPLTFFSTIREARHRDLSRSRAGRSRTEHDHAQGHTP